MRRALVTGASGFIGRHLVAELRTSGWTVTTVSRAPHNMADAYQALGSGPWDVAALTTMLDAVAPDVVFHMAGSTHADLASDLYATNTLLTARMLDAVERSRQPPTVVLAGSAAEYGVVAADKMPVSESEPCHPTTDYAISKYAQTMLGLSRSRRGSKVIVARIFNPVGPGMPGQLALANFAGQISAMPATGGQLYVGNLAVARDFIDVRDAVRCMARLPNAKCFGEVVNICSGQACVLSSLVTDLIRLSGRPIDVIVDAARNRAADMPVFFGNNARLLQLGLPMAAPRFEDILSTLLTNGKTS